MTDELSTIQQEFTDSIDLPAILDNLEIDSIDVNDKRLLVIYSGAILNVKILDGTLDTARKIVIEVLDGPDGRDVDHDRLLTDFKNLLINDR